MTGPVPQLEPAQVRTVIDANSELDFIWRNLRSYLGFKLRVWRNWMRHGHVVRKRAIARYLADSGSPRLHLAATYPVPGFLNSQILGPVPIDITTRLPFPDGVLTLIYSSHLVEHIHRREFHRFLLEGHRVLRPGGVMAVAAPSAEKLARVSYGPDNERQRQLFARAQSYYGDPVLTPSHQLNLAMRGFGHRFLYDSEYMRWIGERVGYAAVASVGNFEVPDEGICAYLKERKPERWDTQTETWLFTKGQS